MSEFLKNPFYNDSKVDYELVCQHLDNYGPFFYEPQKELLRRYNGSFWHLYEIARLKKKLREVLSDKISEKVIENCKDKFLSRVSLFHNLDPNTKAMINFKNGSFCLKEGLLKPHRKEDYFFNRIDASYNSSEKCPKWKKFLNQICEGDSDLISLIQEMFGYCLVPGNSFQVAFILYGTGENGKSVLLDVLRNVLGIRNTCSVSLGELSQRFSKFQLVDKLANICDESPSAKAIESDVFKNMTGEGFITVEQKHKQSFMIPCSAKQIFAANSTLWIKDHTHALFRRLMIIPFDYKVPREQRDNTLKTSLLTELGGIINWAIEGYFRLDQQKRFTKCLRSSERKEEFIRDMDNVKTFLDENCLVGEAFSIFTMDLYESYKKFCDENGYKGCSSGEFGKRIRSHYPEISKKEKSSSGGYKYLGICLRL